LRTIFVDFSYLVSLFKTCVLPCPWATYADVNNRMSSTKRLSDIA